MIETKDLIIDVIDKSSFNYLRDEVNNHPKSKLGVEHNRIVEIPNFVKPETAKKMIDFFENCGVQWGDIAFYGSLGMGLKPDPELLKEKGLSPAFFDDIREKFREAVEMVFERKVRPNTSHAQKWDVGGFASPHSDNSDYDGNPNAFEINKYVGILYLNDDYDGGELFFCDPDNGMEKWLSFKPNVYSYYVFPGGVENVHGVSEILKGTRYTMVSFWDYAEIKYDQATLDRWEEEEKQVRIEQAKQKEEWSKGNKNA
jgi:hypothetical protein